MFLTSYLLLFTLLIQTTLIVADPIFYPEDFDLKQPMNKFGQAIFCKLCNTLLDFVENKLPLKMLGKGPMMIAIRVSF